jgi:hypothetical protein
MVVTEGERTVVRAAFPTPGNYRLRITINRTQDPLADWDLVGSFRFQAQGRGGLI